MSSILHRPKVLHPDSHLVEVMPAMRPSVKTHMHTELLPQYGASNIQSSDLTVSLAKALLRHGGKATSLAIGVVDGALIVAMLASMPR